MGNIVRNKARDRALVVLVVAGLTICRKGFQLHQAHKRQSRRSKPQAAFAVMLADNTDAPFEHPAGLDVSSSDEVSAAAGIARTIRHPLHAEIEALLGWRYEPPATPPTLPADLDTTSAEWVSTPAQLQEMVRRLGAASALGVDVEHHAKHSYLGFICLIQLSTGAEDFVLDALALHDHLGSLKPLFANPSILKVLHGGDNDCLWLQRDAHLYLANVFDTDKASKIIFQKVQKLIKVQHYCHLKMCELQVIGFEQHSLAHLLRKHCNIRVDKSYQRADWRVRPLPQPMLDYARQDAHYLVYLAHCLQWELRSRQDQLQTAWLRSQKMVLHLYAKPTREAAVASATSSILRKLGQSHERLNGTARQHVGGASRDCVIALCQWRDEVAREEDEGVQATMPDSLLVALVESRPYSAEALHELAQPLLREYAGDTLVTERLLQNRANEVVRLLSMAAAGELQDSFISSVHQQSMQPTHAGSGKAGHRNGAEQQAAIRERLIRKFSAKKNVYENCKIFSQDGDLLCFCDLRKLQWYETRGLAKRMSDDPPAIRLLFEHKATDQDTGSDAYYLASKENRCVGCGESSHFLRYKVVPACYRRHFPRHLKSHRSHDIVLLCIDCHQTAHKEAQHVKQQLSQEYNVPLMPPAVPSGGVEFVNGSNGGKVKVHPFNVRRAAVALTQAADKLPEERRQQLEDMIRAHRGLSLQPGPAGERIVVTQTDITESLFAGLGPRQQRKLRERLNAQKQPQDQRQQPTARVGDGSHGSDPEQGCSDTVTQGCNSAHGLSTEIPQEGSEGQAPYKQRGQNSGQMWHGRNLVAAAMKAGGEEALHDIVRRFRQSFKDVLHPKFMPVAWEVDHRAEREFGVHSVYHVSEAEQAASNQLAA